jgi:hypothetical protein
MSGWAKAVSGKVSSSLVMPAWIRWMLVDSSGSMKPEARPSDRQFLFQLFLRRPVVKRRKLRSAMGWPPRLPSNRAPASSSLMNSLE